MELEVKILIIEKKLLYLERIFFIKREEEGGERHQLFWDLFWSFMDGWVFFGELEKKKFAFEEGKDMIGIAYLVEGSGSFLVEE